MSELPGSHAPRCSPPPPRLPGPCSGEPQLQAAAGVQREGEKQQFPLCVRVSARLPARRLPAARSLRSLRALTGFLARSSLMSRRGKRRGLNAPENWGSAGRREAPGAQHTVGGEGLPSCSPHGDPGGLPAPGAPQLAPAPPCHPSCPLRDPRLHTSPDAWLGPFSMRVSPVPLSPASSPRRGAKAAPREDTAETMSHPAQ